MKSDFFSSRWGFVRISIVIAVVCLAIGAGAYLASPASALRAPRLHPLPRPKPAAQPAPPPRRLAPTALFDGSERVAVLMYHDVTDKPSVYFDCATAEFKRQLERLKEDGANVISLEDLYRHLEGRKDIPARSVVLTFDDGYLGTYKNAYPLLKEYGYPAAFFIHTSVVGVKTGKDHMTWEQLRTLDREGLVRVECHTVTHPDDLRKCSDLQLDRELVESKKVLEQKLGREVRFLAYPVGNADARVARAAREAGYAMALTMGPGWAMSPADAFFVPRFLPRYLPEIETAWNAEPPLFSAKPRVVDIHRSDLESGELKDGIVHVRWVRGGRLSGARIPGRRSVPSLVQASGAAAGLNGTFFSDARVNSAGAGIVGPVLSRFGPGFAPGLPGDRERIAGRPLVVISPEQMAFIPFQPQLALDEEGMRRLVPDATDGFIAGAWLIHRGEALTHEQMETFRLENIFDFRPRAFVGIDRDGRPFIGAASTGNMSDRLAESLAKLDLEECVLLDSGFSTSLVVGKEVLVSGIRRADMPARPVPHVLLLHALDPETGQERLASQWTGPHFVGPPNMPTLERLQQELSTGAAVPEEPEQRTAGRRRHSRRPLRRKR